MKARNGLAAMVLCMSILLASVALAEEAEKELGWKDVAELSLVSARGNAESDTFGFKNTAVRTWDNATFTLAAGGLRAETGTITRVGVGTPADFRIVERTDTVLSAENYFLRGQYDRKITDRLFWFVGASWDTNEFAGIDNRYALTAGVGHVWFDDETSRFSTSYGVTFTQQDDIVEVPGVDDSFIGLRGAWDYWRQLTGNTEFGSVLIIDTNFDESEDYRADFTNWVSVAMSERLALKVSYQFQFDNLPSLQSVPLETLAGTATGETVLAELDDLDSLLTVALVVNF